MDLSGKKKIEIIQNSEAKLFISRCIGIDRRNIYYKSKRRIEDEEIKNQIESVQVKNPAYGHRRIALALEMNHKRILRIMKRFNLKPLRRKTKLFKKLDINTSKIHYVNIMMILCPLTVNKIWVSDFTYIKYQRKWIYLAVVQELLTREVMGIAISRYHNRSLVIEALLNALEKSGVKPEYVHSDQGSEYRSIEYIEICQSLGIKISMSDKGSPWQNGQMESFFGRFKEESGDLNRFENLVELIAYIYQQVYYYNNERIHTKLKMSPVKYRVLRRRLLSK